jgi:hypothetical protein
LIVTTGKDLDNNYLFDTVNGTIAGLAVVEDNNMPDNQLKYDVLQHL